MHKAPHVVQLASPTGLSRGIYNPTCISLPSHGSGTCKSGFHRKSSPASTSVVKGGTNNSKNTLLTTTMAAIEPGSGGVVGRRHSPALRGGTSKGRRRRRSESTTPRVSAASGLLIYERRMRLVIRRGTPWPHGRQLKWQDSETRRLHFEQDVECGELGKVRPVHCITGEKVSCSNYPRM